MSAKFDFTPMWAIPPGQTIADLMRSKGIPSARLAPLMGMSQFDFDSLLAGEHPLTADLAARLETVLGATASFWLLREKQFKDQLAQLTTGVHPQNEDYKSWLASLPFHDMQGLGWIKPTKDKTERLRRCLEFFDVPNLDEWYRTYIDLKAATAFRTTDAYLEDAPATAAWLRQGELLAENMQCEDWNPKVLVKQLLEIRALTQIADPSQFLPKLRELCARAGVAVVVLKAPKGCRASGATFFATPTKAVLLLSFRYLSDDQFWFSFFHEAAHLVLHWDAETLILETSDGPRSPREEEANLFASEILIPKQLQKRLPEAAKSLRGILKLARDAGISYGIVVGQMQFRGLVRRDRYNRLKTRYKWDQLAPEY